MISNAISELIGKAIIGLNLHNYANQEIACMIIRTFTALYFAQTVSNVKARFPLNSCSRPSVEFIDIYYILEMFFKKIQTHFTKLDTKLLLLN